MQANAEEKKKKYCHLLGDRWSGEKKLCWDRALCLLTANKKRISFPCELKANEILERSRYLILGWPKPIMFLRSKDQLIIEWRIATTFRQNFFEGVQKILQFPNILGD